MRQPTIYFPHGGGPCFFMDPPPDEPTRWVGLERYLRDLPNLLPERPSAILIISAHWEAAVPTVLMKPKPGMLFDYYGFPPHTYQLSYPAPYSLDLGRRILERLAAAGIAAETDGERDYDHGVFVPLMVSFPEADIPLAQVSLRADLDPAAHVALGAALESLRDENVLIIGSGLSFHNLRALGDPRFDGPARQFDAWLADVLCDGPVANRAARLAAWRAAPGARESHPREEHLLPLMVAVGAAGNDPGRRPFQGTIWNKAISAFHFG